MLRVWDGPPSNEMSLAELSGSLLPEGIHSTLNIVTVQFETDFYISKSGFAIQFSSESSPDLEIQRPSPVARRIKSVSARDVKGLTHFLALLMIRNRKNIDV